jgi:hypothetical protein
MPVAMDQQTEPRLAQSDGYATHGYRQFDSYSRPGEFENHALCVSESCAAASSHHCYPGPDRAVGPLDVIRSSYMIRMPSQMGVDKPIVAPKLMPPITSG